jgi:hypothetical protein
MANVITRASQDSSMTAARLMIASSQLRPVTERPQRPSDHLRCFVGCTLSCSSRWSSTKASPRGSACYLAWSAAYIEVALPTAPRRVA